jgi:hypothetical protein
MKAQILVTGSCPYCGAKFQRPTLCDAAACLCRKPDATLIELKPTLLLPSALYKKYSKLAMLTECDPETLINAFLEEGARRKLREFQPLMVIAAKT